MTSAYILIVAMLILGGLIAALGDRIGTKVGKARLRLFQLRPKQTAIVITIGTGILISASTLLILFTLSESLRQGIFELDEILKKRREITTQLEKVELEKKRVEIELKEAQQRQLLAKQILNTTGKELKNTQNKLKIISSQSAKLNQEVKKIIDEKTKLLLEKENLEKQSTKLEQFIVERDQDLQNKQIQIEDQENILKQQEQSLTKLNKRQNQLQFEIKSRDKQIAKLDQSILAKDKVLTSKEEELLSFEKELAFYRREVEILEQYYQTYQDLRERPIAIVKGQVLTVTLVKTDPETNLEELIDGILNEANRGVMLTLGYGNKFPSQRFVQITKGQVQQIKEQLGKKGEYLIRILSAGNYVQGEENVRIFADVTLNQKVYSKNETIASITIDPNDLKNTELQGKLDFLISVSQFRARRQGVLGKIFVGDGKIISLINFIQELQSSDQSIDEIIAVASNDTYTSGPLQINLIIISDGKEILRL